MHKAVFLTDCSSRIEIQYNYFKVESFGMKAVIESGGKQYIVAVDDLVAVDYLGESTKKSITFDPLMLIDGDKSVIGTPYVEKVKVSAELVEHDFKGPKVTSVKFKAKKRVYSKRGHRQHYSLLKITKLS